jgi:serine/threonine protein kinase
MRSMHSMHSMRSLRSMHSMRSMCSLYLFFVIMPGVVGLPEGAKPVSLAENYIGGHATARIVDEREVCGQGPLVRVLDRTLYPTGLPNMLANTVPELRGFCHQSVYTGMQSAGKLKLPARVAMSSHVHPLMNPLYNPFSNITVLAPSFEGDLNLIANGIIPGSRSVIKDLMALYPLLSILPGGYCPSDFGPEGLVLQSVGGDLAGKNLSLFIRQSEADSNVLDVEIMYGTREKIQAEYIGKFCHSTAYRISNIIMPWRNTTDPSFVDRMPLELAGQLPVVTNTDSMFGVTDTCKYGNMVDRGSENGIGEQLGDGYGSGSSASSTSSLSAGTIAGIVVASCLGIGLIVLLLLLLWRRYRKARALLAPTLQLGKGSPAECCSDLEKTSSSLSTSGSRSTNSLSGFAAEDDLILKESEVTIDKDPESGKAIVLGKGRFGVVLAGSLLGSEQVAIKCIGRSDVPSSDSSNGTDSASFGPLKDAPQDAASLPPSGSFSNVSRGQILKEIELLKSCHSQYIVSFIGAMFRPHEIRLVTELMPCGDLWNALGHGAGPRMVNWYDSGIFIAMDVAAGLNYLHEKKRVIHLDLKSSNILLRESTRESLHVESAGPSPSPGAGSGLGSNPASGPGSSPLYRGRYHAKVSDVGLSKILPTSHEYLTSMEGGGTWNWCAPEVILNTKCTPSADMYSYGVVLWEICTGEIPVRGRMRDVRVPEECPQSIADLIHQCLTWDPPGHLPVLDVGNNSTSLPKKTRPTAAQCIAVLQSVLAESSKAEPALP